MAQHLQNHLVAAAGVKTWMIEVWAVALILGFVVALSGGGWIEVIGAVAVLATFAHAQVSDRFAEYEALKAKPDVGCHRWSLRYFVTKELLWLAYFVAHRSWSALVGVGVFLLYPLWRRWWRTRFPIRPAPPRGPAIFINHRRFEIAGEYSLRLGETWHATAVLLIANREEATALWRLTEPLPDGENLPLALAFQTGSGLLLLGKGDVLSVHLWRDLDGSEAATLDVRGKGELTHA